MIIIQYIKLTADKKKKQDLFQFQIVVLQNRQNEIQFGQQEREKLLEKAEKKFKDSEDKWGHIPQHLYEYLSEVINVKLLKTRFAYEDCGAGVIFDNFQSKYLPDELDLMKCIMEINSIYKQLRQRNNMINMVLRFRN
ncbi:unnamed protein product [Paramecium sonneborni]|uniref:Uncharacterized protein n=1 Tax=Paramecium sonneborni TaxID=65129 RepID=A0A8S1RQD9_9CILI|nr:unnamed protein product [Paramecium sonneborni]